MRQRQNQGAVLVWDAIAFQPALHCGMIAMAQLAGYRANTTASAYQFCVGHDAYVRRLRTQVNVESVRCLPENVRMIEKRSIGGQLMEFRRIAGLSMDAVAARAGYKGRSSVQRYFDESYDPEFLPRNLAEKLAQAFEGTGVQRADIMALAGLPDGNGIAVKFQGAPDILLERSLPIYGTALGAPRNLEGHAVEQTMLNTGYGVGFIPRPSILRNVKDAYALYVQGSSMSPRFDPGETLVVTDGRLRPPRIGDDVVVYMRDMEEDDGQRSCAVLVKRLVRRSASFIELEQFNPPLVFRVDVAHVVRLDRVVPWAEILS